MGVITIIIVGLIAGWLASLVMKGRGLGAFGDIIVGIIGALIGGYLFRQLGYGAESFLGTIVTATIGAIILLFLIGLVKRERV